MREDNTGFINFPNPNNKHVLKIETGKTFIYIVSFDSSDMSGRPYDLSKVKISLPGVFVGDDVTHRLKNINESNIDDLIENEIENDRLDKMFFPQIDEVDNLNSQSISMISCICVGWSNSTYEIRENGPWFASFRDLTNEGRKLYYSMKKLHNTKEVRILTFNNI